MERQAGGWSCAWRRGLTIPVVVLLAKLVGAGGVDAGGGGAAPPPPGTIYFQRITVPADTLAVAPDGSGLRETGCPGGDRTMTTPRRVLRLEPTGVTFPVLQADGSGWPRNELRLVSTNEACGDRIVLLELPARMTASAASWSPDGTRVAVAAVQYDEAGILAEQGIWTGDIGGACGEAVCGWHLAVALPMTPVAGSAGPTRYYAHELAAVRWSSDGRRVVESRRVDPARDEYGIFVADLVLGTERWVAVPGGSALQPVFSPVAGDDRIAFVQGVSTKSCYRNDVFITSSAGGTTRRVTTTGMCQLADPTWSPDGTWLAVSAWSGAMSDLQSIYRLKADGSVKPALVASVRNAAFRNPIWCR